MYAVRMQTMVDSRLFAAQFVRDSQVWQVDASILLLGS